MTRPVDHCDPRRLEQFLRDPPTHDSERELEAHLLACPACRDRLDQLAGGVPWWLEVRHYLGDDGAMQAIGASDSAERRTPPHDLTFLQPSSHPTALGKLGTYEVLEVLGQGGTGIVLKAFDPALHRPVAIKVLAAPYAARGAARKRFAREARAAAAIAHEHVVAIHAVDADAAPPYLVMAFIAGQSLQQRLDRDGPLELKEILRIGMQTAQGLAAAHAQGLVHRDIKPANLMLENDVERVKITDFGLARAIDDASATQTAVVAGTPPYMAPEQARGEPVDQRGDLFALGSTLYTAATGRPPFRGDSGWAILRQVCEVEPPSIRSFNPELPIWLEGIVRKLLAKDPAQRFASAREVADLLENCLAHVQQPDRHPLPRLATDLGRAALDARHASKRRRWPVAVTALLGSVLCGGLLFLLWRSVTTPEQSTASSPSHGALAAAETELQPNSPDAFAPSDRGAGLEPAFVNLRERIQSLRQSLTSVDEANVEAAIDLQMQTLRRRVERLQYEFSRQP